MLCSTPLQAAQTGRSSHQKALPDLKTAQFIPGSVQGCYYQCGFPIFPEGNVWEYTCKPVPCTEDNKAATRINGVGEINLIINHPPCFFPTKFPWVMQILTARKLLDKGTTWIPSSALIPTLPLLLQLLKGRGLQITSSKHLIILISKQPENQLFHYGNIMGLAPFHAGEQLPEPAGDPSAPGAAW